MTDIHAQQFQTVQQVAETITALTQRLSDLRQLAEFMSKSEAMAAELATYRSLTPVNHDTAPRLYETRAAMNDGLGARVSTADLSQVKATVSSPTSMVVPMEQGEEPPVPVPGVPGATITRTRKHGGGQ